MKVVKIGHGKISLEQVEAVAAGRRKVDIHPAAARRIQKAHVFLQREMKTGRAIYGVNTGFGYLSNVRVPDEDLETLQYNLLRSHAVGVGDPMPDPVVKAMLLLRAHALAFGHSGVSLTLVRQIVKVLNAGICPLIPHQGSVGASGDLAPLAHLALVLIGEGKARRNGKLMSGAAALKSAGLKPIRLGPKEGLALINGTQFMTAIGALAVLDAEYLADFADVVGALTLEAMRGTVKAFDPDIHRVRSHPGQAESAARIRKMLREGGASTISKSHVNCTRVQDPYSLRCMPQVHGATRDALKFVRGVLEREVNAVTDNPLIFPEAKKILSGGNFHGQVVSLAMDTLAIAVAELASISEQRLHKLINPVMSELPAFLVKESGLNSGFMIVQVAAASIVSENKTLAHPAVVDSIPTSADKEDHVSMGAWAARKASRVVKNTRRVLAMEALAAAQGIDLLRPLRTTPFLERTHRLIRSRVRTYAQDRIFSGDLETAERMIGDREFVCQV
ncbi:MAG: histidine ammonia-lyase [Bacteriovoracia bacterium]